MKTFSINVAGKNYVAEVEILEDNDTTLHPYYDPSLMVEPSLSSMFGANIAASQPAAKKAAGDDKTMIAPINGIVLEIRVKEGDEVKENDVVFVFEAMKMKSNVACPISGKVKSINISIGDNVDADTPVLTFE